MSASWPWTVLGLNVPAETDREVRRAYATRLRSIDVEADITGFEALRSAYEAALDQVVFRSRREDDVQVIEEADVRTTASPDQTAKRVETTASRKSFLKPSTLLPTDDNRTIASIAAHLEQMNYAVDAWQKLLSEKDISTPEANLLVEHLVVRSLSARAHNAPLPPESWLRLMDARYGWSTDGVGFSRRHPKSEGLLGDVVERLNTQARPHSLAGGRPVHLLLRWYAIVIYTLVFFVFRSVLYV